ncbi:FMN-binding protein [Candidatus Collierbacteria bacterium]|nr:FMN-binding protein [Candidatus Collierbacteria bacterium]
MDSLKKITGYFSGQARSIIFSLLGGSALILLWLSLEQIKTEPKLPFWDITDIYNENETEDLLEKQQLQTKPQAGQPRTRNPQSPPSPAVQVTQAPRLGPYKDGIYKASSGTPWGKTTIAIKIVNGKWENINLTEIPNSPPSQYAASFLANQALKAQNGKIDGVSGATYTSNAFRDDLNQIAAQSKS